VLITIFVLSRFCSSASWQIIKHVHLINWAHNYIKKNATMQAYKIVAKVTHSFAWPKQSPGSTHHSFHFSWKLPPRRHTFNSRYRDGNFASVGAPKLDSNRFRSGYRFYFTPMGSPTTRILAHDFGPATAATLLSTCHTYISRSTPQP
jgi:hypothetical protein